MNLLPQLFWSFLQIGLFSIGGGYAAMPLIQAQVVDAHNWLSLQEFADLVTIAEMTPGPIAVNGATFVGIRVAGIPGAVIATLGCILPSILIVSVLAYVYKRWRNLRTFQDVLSALRPVIVALIAAAGLRLLLAALFPEGISLQGLDPVALLLFLGAMLLLRKWKKSPVLVIFLSGGLGAALYYLTEAFL